LFNFCDADSRENGFAKWQFNVNAFAWKWQRVGKSELSKLPFNAPFASKRPEN
jgi:hypothetical protein